MSSKLNRILKGAKKAASNVDDIADAAAKKAAKAQADAAAKTVKQTVKAEKAAAKKSAQDVANSKSINDWVRQNKTQDFDTFAESINNGSSESVLKDLYEKNSYVRDAMGKDATFDTFKTMSSADKLKTIEQGRTLRANNPTFMDTMGYHKVPQVAAGIGTTAWLVSRLSESKGQMSNQQLYGQQPY